MRNSPKSRPSTGDPARAGMLQALMDGRALTASELARVASITPQTASGHLTRMTAAGLLSVEKQGRHRYHRLATPAVAHMMESIMQVASDRPAPKRLTTGPRDAALRDARTCYDHLAGKLGVALADALVRKGYAELTSDAGIITGQAPLSSAASVSIWTPCWHSRPKSLPECSVVPVSTGVSGGRISQARSAPRCVRIVSKAAGSGGWRGPAR